MIVETLVDPDYKPTSGRQTIDDVLFKSYRTGINRYCQISEDGQIMICASYRRTTYSAEILGHGYLKNPKTGYSIKFRTQDGAARAAIKIHRNLKKDQAK